MAVANASAWPECADAMGADCGAELCALLNFALSGARRGAGVVGLCLRVLMCVGGWGCDCGTGGCLRRIWRRGECADGLLRDLQRDVRAVERRDPRRAAARLRARGVRGAM